MDKLVGKGFDGASNMCGRLSANFQNFLGENAPRPPYLCTLPPQLQTSSYAPA